MSVETPRSYAVTESALLSSIPSRELGVTSKIPDLTLTALVWATFEDVNLSVNGVSAYVNPSIYRDHVIRAIKQRDLLDLLNPRPPLLQVLNLVYIAVQLISITIFKPVCFIHPLTFLRNQHGIVSTETFENDRLRKPYGKIPFVGGISDNCTRLTLKLVIQQMTLWVRVTFVRRARDCSSPGATWIINDGADDEFDSRKIPRSRDNTEEDSVACAENTPKESHRTRNPIEDSEGETYCGAVIHSSKFNRADLDGRMVLVINSRASGVKIVETALSRGAEHTMVISSVTRHSPSVFASFGRNLSFSFNIVALKISSARYAFMSRPDGVLLRSKDSPERDEEIDGDVVVFATGFKKPSLDFLPQDLFPENHERPNYIYEHVGE
ncbi:hypothetical protein B0F90DRAFT_1668174 [Multifurca ochricompacta]|uniref:Uncharacterized protein n=1 Tax=Multifurca ochricompacta TaxID=376703 RepID=A0AAD4QKT0_9AGAM|nr:hypothetical protein B0F90DRAFT_1668174 [Multifurca ochricompacta]